MTEQKLRALFEGTIRGCCSDYAAEAGTEDEDIGGSECERGREYVRFE